VNAFQQIPNSIPRFSASACKLKLHVTHTKKVGQANSNPNVNANVNANDAATSQKSNHGLLTPEQKDFLDSLDTNIYGSPFIERLCDLQEYKNQHGTCHVPKRYAENPSLGNWVNKSRQMYRKHLEGGKTSMTPARVQVLNEIGFIWSGTKNTAHARVKEGQGQGQDAKNNIWNNHFQELKRFIEKNGTSISLSSSTKLGVWAARQRREYQKLNLDEKCSITQERVDLLNSIGFDWNPWNTKWRMRVNELLEYKSQHGNCSVPVQYPKNPKLGRWVSTQRKYYKLYKEGKPTRISKEKIEELADAGFIWNRWDDVWNDCEDEWDSSECKVDR